MALRNGPGRGGVAVGVAEALGVEVCKRAEDDLAWVEVNDVTSVLPLTGAPERSVTWLNLWVWVSGVARSSSGICRSF